MKLAKRDKDKNKIIGAVYANLIEKIPFGKKKFLIGQINDVSCHPDYTKMGIATNLMNKAIEYMKKKGCDFSILSTGYNNFARCKIYKKLGYIDLEKEYLFIQFPNIFRLIRDFIGFAFFLPIFFITSYIPRFLNRLRIKFHPFFKDLSYEINYNQNHYKYLKSFNQIFPKYYDGFPKYNKNKFTWARIKVPAKRQKPTYILIKRRNKIIGGALITHQNIYAFKYGIKLRIGLIHEIFLDKHQFKHKQELRLGYIYLIDKILKAATKRFLGILIYKSSFKDFDLHRGFKAINFLKIQDDVLMIKKLKNNLKLPILEKPIFVPPYVSLGFP